MNLRRSFTGITASAAILKRGAMTSRTYLITVIAIFMLSLTFSTSFGKVIHLYIGKDDIAADETVLDLLNEYYSDIVNITIQKHCKRNKQTKRFILSFICYFFIFIDYTKNGGAEAIEQMLSQPADGTHLALVYTPDLYLFNYFGGGVKINDLAFPYMFSFTPIPIITKAKYTSMESLLSAAAERALTSGEDYEPIKICTSSFISAGFLLQNAIEKADPRAKYLKLVTCDMPYEEVVNGSDDNVGAAYVGLPIAIKNRENKDINFVAISGKYNVVDLPDTKLLSYLGFSGTDLTSLRGFAVNKNVSSTAITELAEQLHKAHKVKKYIILSF